ncbi:acetyl-CoA C-acetyltransferase/acetyl-CoA acyltransferase 2 [Planomicrobium koreense]|uniref:acetyl-CoA C-acetyltransferase n=1 Tax=Planococcus koreensis TaxID=112331 RepID=A0A7W8FUN8_9BACL|nr:MULTISPECIES: acetyl-CoA C-acetyltransferase [Planococcus]MBB5181331.1 acetyl-CoA C-acetyltransferase/acetyl-CoA acyltransferase 2 [Planococcus koreensis]MDN3448904.1 acetyl-CoA C-acetyltransferase [Planococcus sp. APC 3906]
MENVYLVNGARTAFGGFGGSFANVGATELGTATAVEALKRSNVRAEDIDHVVYGNVIHSSVNAAYLARHIGLKAGVPKEVPALTLNRLCGSGAQAVVTAAQNILLGEADMVLAGGAENMSMSPYANFNQRFNGPKMGNMQFEDMLTATLTDQYTGAGMGMTAEKLAEQYSISREEQDAFAVESHQRAARATENGVFAKEIVGVEVKTRKGTVVVDKDEHIKPEASTEVLGKLRPAFKKDGTVTAGNASGINDGAASVVIAGQAAVDRHGLEPIARIVSWGVAGVDPTIMGIGPVPAIKQALERAALSLEDIDLFEINEAFAAQYLAVEKELGLSRDKVNVNGGAVALGHPVGTSGTRILLSAAYELKRRGAKYAVASLCIGGGQGIAVVIEST